MSLRTTSNTSALRSIVVGSTVLLLGLFTGLHYLQQTEASREVSQWPQRDQYLWVQSEVELLQQHCRNVKSAELTDYCEQHAHIVTLSKACDDSCRQLARTFLSPPTR